MEKKAIKNGELLSCINGCDLISGLKMPGIVSLAVTKGRREVVKAYEIYMETRKQILETRSKKDPEGNAIIIDSPTDNDPKAKKYDFESQELEEEATAELKILSKVEVKLILDKIDTKMIESLECTPEQIEVILLLTEQ